MNFRFLTLLPILLIVTPSLLPAEIQREQVTTAAELQALLTEKVDSLEIYLQPGDYYLSPEDIIDSTCGNCPEPEQFVAATVGLAIAGNYVRIRGPGPRDRSAEIHTNAGYGIFFNHCKTGILENVAITGGTRDLDGNATDAAIVVKNSTVTIRHNRIYRNIGDSSIVVKNIVGIMGICGRENSDITIVRNEIIGNSWDGIALYRDASATISGNLIDGVDKATAKVAGGGRGVGIGVTWNAQATIEGNLVTRYWKGIGIFVDARVTARNNIVEDVLAWGIAYWDAGEGAPIGFIEDNVVYSTGACGISISRSKPGPAPGHLIGNVIVKTAQNPKYDAPDYYCHQCALSISAKPDNFPLADNLFFDNREATEDLPDYDIAESEFAKYAEALRKRLLITPLLRRSDFAQYLSDL
jgi:parallel beta-helix repeat protein